jgi:hypothetical protein
MIGIFGGIAPTTPSGEREEPWRDLAKERPDTTDMIEVMRDGWDVPRRMVWSRRPTMMNEAGLKWRPVKKVKSK